MQGYKVETRSGITIMNSFPCDKYVRKLHIALSISCVAVSSLENACLIERNKMVVDDL